MNKIKFNTLIAIVLIISAATLRVVNANVHLYNLAPVTAMGVFGGAILKDKKWMALLIPVLGQLLGDVMFQLFSKTPGFYNGQILNYVAIALSAVIGLAITNIRSIQTVVGVLGGSMVFFIVSNFGFFLEGYNGYSFAGLSKTYIDAIPFFNNTLVGDVVAGSLLFGGYLMAEQMFINKLRKAKQQ